MLDEKAVTEFVEKIRKASEVSAMEALQLLCAARDEDAKEPAAEIAKTICEILDPERLGKINWILCRNCGGRLTPQDRDRGYCPPCYG